VTTAPAQAAVVARQAPNVTYVSPVFKSTVNYAAPMATLSFIGTPVQATSSGLAQVSLESTAQIESLSNADVTWDMKTNMVENGAATLSNAYLLGQPSTQPVAAGTAGYTTDSFNYWTDTLVV
jgi:hypothetical protein